MRLNRAGGFPNGALNKLCVYAFDPGGTTGWARLVVDYRAFSRPENKVLRWLDCWDCGELHGMEARQLQTIVDWLHADRYTLNYKEIPHNRALDVITESFELTQLVGGNELLTPVRMNAVLGWECGNMALQLTVQPRQMRTTITPQWLNQAGFSGKWQNRGKGKDAFAAMQHAVTWLRRTKRQSLGWPWKLSDQTNHNAYWDCACMEKAVCDLQHPK